MPSATEQAACLLCWRACGTWPGCRRRCWRRRPHGGPTSKPGCMPGAVQHAYHACNACARAGRCATRASSRCLASTQRSGSGAPTPSCTTSACRRSGGSSRRGCRRYASVGAQQGGVQGNAARATVCNGFGGGEVGLAERLVSGKRSVVCREALHGFHAGLTCAQPLFASLKRLAPPRPEPGPHASAPRRPAPPQVKNPAKRAEMQAQLTRVEQQLRNEEAKRKKDQFERQVKVRAGGGKARAFVSVRVGWGGWRLHMSEAAGHLALQQASRVLPQLVATALFQVDPRRDLPSPPHRTHPHHCAPDSPSADQGERGGGRRQAAVLPQKVGEAAAGAGGQVRGAQGQVRGAGARDCVAVGPCVLLQAGSPRESVAGAHRGAPYSGLPKARQPSCAQGHAAVAPPPTHPATHTATPTPPAAQWWSGEVHDQAAQEERGQGPPLPARGAAAGGRRGVSCFRPVRVGGRRSACMVPQRAHWPVHMCGRACHCKRSVQNACMGHQIPANADALQPWQARRSSSVPVARFKAVGGSQKWRTAPRNTVQATLQTPLQQCCQASVPLDRVPPPATAHGHHGPHKSRCGSCPYSCSPSPCRQVPDTFLAHHEPWPAVFSWPLESPLPCCSTRSRRAAPPPFPLL